MKVATRWTSTTSRPVTKEKAKISRTRTGQDRSSLATDSAVTNLDIVQRTAGRRQEHDKGEEEKRRRGKGERAKRKRGTRMMGEKKKKGKYWKELKTNKGCFKKD